MKIKDLQVNQGKVDLVLEVLEKEEPRTFEKFGKSGRVCNAKVKDDTGSVTLTLWNDDVDKLKVGDTIHLQNGWCSEFKEQKQISAGKFGKIEVVNNK
ncbi:DNA-binding protein [Candidatus Woesearchaeota archaeon]|nr:DNA-binding protein [Candidatus Woesearchaeota archaeon]MBI2581504.1 DNA-binding protein [Candidatus Woesearchaeota archaeon]